MKVRELAEKLGALVDDLSDEWPGGHDPEDYDDGDARLIQDPFLQGRVLVSVGNRGFVCGVGQSGLR